MSFYLFPTPPPPAPWAWHGSHCTCSLHPPPGMTWLTLYLFPESLPTSLALMRLLSCVNQSVNLKYNKSQAESTLVLCGNFFWTTKPGVHYWVQSTAESAFVWTSGANIGKSLLTIIYATHMVGRFVSAVLNSVAWSRHNQVCHSWRPLGFQFVELQGN